MKNISGEFSSPQDFEQHMISDGMGSFTCKLCDYTKTRTHVRNHVESIHFPNTFTYNCDICGKEFGTNNAFSVHRKRMHK